MPIPLISSRFNWVDLFLVETLQCGLYPQSGGADGQGIFPQVDCRPAMQG